MYGVESVWTELRIATLKELWATGASAGQIAAELGEVSRNSVLGKVHRLKLAKRVQVSLPRAERGPRRFREDQPMPVQYFQHVMDWLDHIYPELGQPVSQGCALMDLTNHTCRWPLWNDAKPEHLYCGAPGADLENKIPYCQRHSRMAYQRRSAQ